MLYDYFFFSAPQLKRDPLGSSGTHEMHRPLPQFDNAHYGSGTARIREIVVAGHSVRWFPNRGPADQSEQSLVALHLEVFSSFYPARDLATRDRKSTRLNSSHGYISYAVFCLKKKNT